MTAKHEFRVDVTLTEYYKAFVDANTAEEAYLAVQDIPIDTDHMDLISNDVDYDVIEDD